MSKFFKFIQSNRAEIGLVDRFDLSEIYSADERFALSNIGLNPDGLDQIFKLSSDGLTKEDIRTMGGLDRPIIHSLAISDRTLGGVSNDLFGKITTDKAIGEPGKHSFTNNSESDNIVIFHGGIAAKKIEYNFLDENGEVRTTTVPTSRESLFNSTRNVAGDYTEVSYPGLFRIRRRSHVNEIKLGSKLLIPRGAVVESPTDTLNLPVYMRTGSNTSPGVTTLQCYATKNSPIVLPVRIFNSASISFSRQSANSGSPGFVFGWELKRQSDLATVRGGSVNSVGAITTVNISISTAGTIGNGVDCLLYVYLDPSVITVARLSGIGLRELSGGQDIGLVGFNALKDLDISNNGLSTLPVWLKTLHGTLERLNIRENVFWNNGIVSHFDYQDLRGSGITGASSAAPPNLALSQVLGYSGWADTGRLTQYDGDFATIQDKVGTLYKDSRANSISGGTLPQVDFANGFRPFTALRELNIGPHASVVNGDFYTLFPNLQTIVLDSPGASFNNIIGLFPRLRNNGALMAINFTNQQNAGGSIKYIGSTSEWATGLSNADKQQFIGQFKVTSFNIRDVSVFGGIATGASDVPNATVDGKPRYHHIESGSVSEAWAGWLAETQSIDAHFTDVAVKLATGNSLLWNKLRSIDVNFAGSKGIRNKIIYNSGVSGGDQTAADVIQAPQLGSINAYSAGWSGKLFSIEGANNLTFANLGNNDWEGFTDSEGRQYLFPNNFATQATESQFSRLNAIYFHYNINGAIRDLEFRENDLENLPKLSTFYILDSYFTGKFPRVVNNSLTSGVFFNTWIRNCRFRDVSALGSAFSSRVRTIFAPGQGTGVGGSLLPNFASQSTNTSLVYVNFDSSLSSRYPGNWANASLRNKVISPLVTGAVDSSTPSVTWSSRNNNNTSSANSDKLYHNSPGAFIPSSEIMVGDVVTGAGVPSGTRVTQIDRNGLFVYINNEVTITTQTLTFTRAGQNISGFFDNHLSLDEVYLSNCRVSGAMPTFANCTNIRFINLRNNLLSQYVVGTFKNITGVSTSRRTTPALRIAYLEDNAFTPLAIRDIISDMHDIAVYYASLNIRPNIQIRLLGTKLNTALNQYQNYTRAEIFTQGSTFTDSAGETITIPDPLETKFNQLGPGRLYPGVSIELF
jgi:hypothetical protein